MPGYMDWWGDMGRKASQQCVVYLRTAIRSIAAVGQVRFTSRCRNMWGILAGAARGPSFKSENYGKPGLAGSPGDTPRHAAPPDVIQGDTEPASVEQQRHSARPRPRSTTCAFVPGQCRGRPHLWAMVYLLQEIFGRDGREEAR